MKKLKFLALTILTAFALSVFAGCSLPGQDDAPPINATIILVLEDETEITYDIEIKGNQTIRQALYEAKLIDDENNVSMFVKTIDGHTADAVNDGVTWMPYDENGKELQGGSTDVICALGAHTVNDGQTIRLVYTVVPFFDD